MGKLTKEQAKEQQQTAEFLHALGEPTRLRIVDALNRYGRLSVTDLANQLDIDLVNTSHHLRILKNAGILESTKDGRFVMYEIDAEKFKKNGVVMLPFLVTLSIR